MRATRAQCPPRPRSRRSREGREAGRRLACALREHRGLTIGEVLGRPFALPWAPCAANLASQRCFVVTCPPIDQRRTPGPCPQAVGGGERGTGLRGFSSSEGFSVTRALGIKSDRELRLEVLQDELSNAEEVRDKDGKVTRTVRQSAFEYGIKGAGVESSMDLTEQQLQGGSGLRAEYEHVHTFDASELDLSAIVPGTPSKAMISMVQNGPNRGSTIPADWKAFKSGAAVDVPGMLATLDSIFATDAKTRAVIADLKTRYTAAQVQLAEAMKMPEQPDWKQLSAVGAPFAEFLGEVKKVYDAEAALKRPADAELMAGKEKEYKEEVRMGRGASGSLWSACHGGRCRAVPARL